MDFLGKNTSFPFRPDARGTFAVVADDDDLIRQAIVDLIETRPYERKMLPNFGLMDWAFDPLGTGFAARLAFFIEQQLKNYLTALEDVSADAGSLNGVQFTLDALPLPHTAAVRVTYRKRGEAVPQELIYPTWRLK